ncbi:hypothetical protein C8J57DRAFT_1517867 [Mycena rebaudengoi]|nr:hypothetical protein C8J57DRAFT_1517867 [Mycena rebaudengoi]
MEDIEDDVVVPLPVLPVDYEHILMPESDFSFPSPRSSENTYIPELQEDDGEDYSSDSDEFFSFDELYDQPTEPVDKVDDTINVLPAVIYHIKIRPTEIGRF